MCFADNTFGRRQAEKISDESFVEVWVFIATEKHLGYTSEVSYLYGCRCVEKCGHGLDICTARCDANLFQQKLEKKKENKTRKEEKIERKRKQKLVVV